MKDVGLHGVKHRVDRVSLKILKHSYKGNPWTKYHGKPRGERRKKADPAGGGECILLVLQESGIEGHELVKL